MLRVKLWKNSHDFYQGSKATFPVEEVIVQVRIFRIKTETWNTEGLIELKILILFCELGSRFADFSQAQLVSKSAQIQGIVYLLKFAYLADKQISINLKFHGRIFDGAV